MRSASRVYRRFYWLEEETMQLKWEPSKKDSDKARVLVQEGFRIRAENFHYQCENGRYQSENDRYFSESGRHHFESSRYVKIAVILLKLENNGNEKLAKDIHEVRSGKNSEVFLSVDTTEHFPEECAFSIVYGEDYLTLDLVAATTEEANIWCTGLRCLISGRDLRTSQCPPHFRPCQFSSDFWSKCWPGCTQSGITGLIRSK